MANSYVEYTTAGSGTNGLGQTTFTAPTQFLSINDIRVKGYNGSSWTELTISSRGTTTVTLSATPTSGSYSKIRVFRSSTTEALIDFQNGSRLAESDLDTAYRQSLFVAQEVAEDADPEGGSGIGNIVSSQLANVSITNSNLAGGITNDKLASGVGTSANNLVQLDANAKLPAVDGSQLTNVSGGGKVLQVIQTINNTASSAFNDTTFTDISGMSASITPTATNSKILVNISLSWGSDLNPYGAVRLLRDSTTLTVGSQTGTSHTQALFGLQGVDNQYRLMCDSFQLLDSTISTTSQVTYKLQWRTNEELYLNRVHDLQTATNANVTSGVSTLTLMEIAG